MKKLAVIILLLSFIIVSCKKKKLNENLYEDSKSSNLSFYQGKDTILSAKGGSPHGSFKLKFNSTAISHFGVDGKLPLGGTFSNGSVIVKEVYNGSSLSLYAIMKKDDSKFSGNGWLWAEYDPNGKVVYSVAEKGKSCIGCHSAGANRDLTKSFDLH